VSEPAVTYVPRHDATPEGELNALANAFKFILFESSDNKKVTAETTPHRVKYREELSHVEQRSR
jgi:hypothetical protein